MLCADPTTCPCSVPAPLPPARASLQLAHLNERITQVEAGLEYAEHAVIKSQEAAGDGAGDQSFEGSFET